MKENDSDGRIDPLLLPFLHTTDEREAGRHLDRLIAHATPGIATITKSSRTPEDAFQEATYRVVKHLQQLRAHRNGNAIGNYLHYVRVVASRVVKGQVREEHPRHRSLVDALRHVLRSEPALASWDSNGQKLCGLAAWRDQQPGRVHSERLTRLLDEPRTFADSVAPKCDLVNVNYADLLKHLFEWIGQPIRFDEVTKIVCGLKQIEDLNPVAGGEIAGRGLGEWLADKRRRPDEDAEWGEFLERLWAEIERLPRLHRLAYLLNFTAADGQVELFWLYGIASIRRIGAALQLAEEEFARAWPALRLNDEMLRRAQACETHDDKFAVLWQHLPLTDSCIACLLGTDRQKVINLRKAAGDRLSRLMARGKSAKLTPCIKQRSRAPLGMVCLGQAAVRKKNGIGEPSFSRSARRLPSAAAGTRAIAGS
jgi:DNA-directed RNA polymerase specialized sigma24 family protein